MLKHHKSQGEAKALVFHFYSGREQITYPKSLEVLWQPLGYLPTMGFISPFYLKICILAHVFYTSWALQWICLTYRQCRPMVCIVSHQPSPGSRYWLSDHQRVLWEDGWESTQPSPEGITALPPHTALKHRLPCGAVCATGNCRTHSTFLNYTSKQSHG